MKAPNPTENAMARWERLCRDGQTPLCCGVLRRASIAAQDVQDSQWLPSQSRPGVRAGEGWGGQTGEKLGGASRSQQTPVDLIGHVLMHVTAVHEMPVHQSASCSCRDSRVLSMFDVCLSSIQPALVTRSNSAAGKI